MQTRFTIIDPVPKTYNPWMSMRKFNYPKSYYAAGVIEPGYFGTPTPPGTVPAIGDFFPLVTIDVQNPVLRYNYTGPDATWSCTGGGGSTGPPAPPTPVDVWLPPRKVSAESGATGATGATGGVNLPPWDVG